MPNERYKNMMENCKNRKAQKYFTWIGINIHQTKYRSFKLVLLTTIAHHFIYVKR